MNEEKFNILKASLNNESTENLNIIRLALYVMRWKDDEETKNNAWHLVNGLLMERAKPPNEKYYTNIRYYPGDIVMVDKKPMRIVEEVDPQMGYSHTYVWKEIK